MSREAIVAALELAGSRCCDNEDDREAIADVVLEVLRNQTDALVIRELFLDATTCGKRMEIAASHGANLGALTEAAYRLAGGRS